jgi:two-component system, NarL family, sensor kinase
VQERDLTLWAFFIAGVLSVAVILAAFLAALLIAQRRRIAVERAHAQRILAAQEEERSRVARELHDDALQRIAVIRHELDEASRHGTPEMAHRIEGVSGELADLGTVLRTAAHHLHPSVVEKAGLPRALGALAEEFGRTAGLEVRLVVPRVDLAVPPTVGVAAYRIAQEALRNIVKHAGVNQADLALDAAADGALTIRVSDAGKGFDAAAAEKDEGLGLIAMRQRAEAVGGRLTFAARAGGGTEVTAIFPPARPR